MKCQYFVFGLDARGIKQNFNLRYLDNEGSKNNTTEDGVIEDAFKDIPLAVDLAGVDLVEQLHHYKRVEDDGVVFGRWRVKGCVPAAVDVKQFLSCTGV